MQTVGTSCWSLLSHTMWRASFYATATLEFGPVMCSCINRKKSGGFDFSEIFYVGLAFLSDLCGSNSKLVIEQYEVINFTSPNYPLVFPSDVTCLWLIYSASDDIDIFIKFVIFQIRQGFSWLNIGMGDTMHEDNTMLKLSGSISRAPSSVIGTSVMWMELNAHEFATEDEVGFWLDIRGVEANCK